MILRLSCVIIFLSVIVPVNVSEDWSMITKTYYPVNELAKTVIQKCLAQRVITRAETEEIL
jgi:hypothetical protein